MRSGGLKVHEELKRRGVTLMILWEEHRAAYVDGHGYSRFCRRRLQGENRLLGRSLHNWPSD